MQSKNVQSILSQLIEQIAAELHFLGMYKYPPQVTIPELMRIVHRRLLIIFFRKYFSQQKYTKRSFYVNSLSKFFSLKDIKSMYKVHFIIFFLIVLETKDISQRKFI